MFIIFSDPTNNWLNEFLIKWGVPLSFVAAGLVFVAVLVLFLIAFLKRKKDPMAGIKKPLLIGDINKIVEAIGGRENVVAHSLTGSRIVLVLKNYNVVNEELLNQNGIDSVIKMSNKITLVSKSDASKIYTALFH